VREESFCEKEVSVETDRKNILYVVKKQLVLKNTGRFIQEHNCSSDEAHL